MNKVIEVLLSRKSIRAYEDRLIEPEIKARILQATLRAPTGGNLMLYSTATSVTLNATTRA